jgi:hypothetical protein
VVDIDLVIFKVNLRLHGSPEKAKVHNSRLPVLSYSVFAER